MALDYSVNLFSSAIVSAGGTVDDLFTLTSSNESVDNLAIRFTNVTGTAATVSAWCQSAAGVEADADKFLSAYSVPGNDYRDIDVPRMVGAGTQAKLSVTAGTASAISVTQLSGIKRT